MKAQWFIFIKTFLKSSLDNYILPGTLTGTEILWLYMVQWKRDMTTHLPLLFASQDLKAGELSPLPFHDEEAENNVTDPL